MTVPSADLVMLALLGATLALWAVFAGTEATLAESRTVVRSADGPHRLGWLFYELHRYPRRLLISLAIGRELALAGAAVVATVLGYERAGIVGGLAASAAIAVLMVVLRGLAAGIAARRVAREGGSLGGAFGWLLVPLRGLASTEKRVGRALAHAFLGTAPSGDNIFAPEELAVAAAEGEDAGDELAGAERTLVAKAIDFEERSVRDVLTPRRDMVMVAADATPEELLRVVRRSGCSRIPVFRGDKDDVVGLLYVKDLIGRRLGPGDVEPLLRQPYVVSAECSCSHLLRELRGRKVHIALVVDEHGTLAGLVTMEDLLEELFGEIRDELDEDEEPAIRRRGPGSFLVSGRASVRSLNARLKLRLPLPDGEATIAGVLIDRIGRVPASGERIDLDGATVTVEQVDGPAIVRVRFDVWSSYSSD
jgi:CBS domain containing-hemolysin-like protein